jgi:hypothetical protein
LTDIVVELFEEYIRARKRQAGLVVSEMSSGGPSIHRRT